MPLRPNQKVDAYRLKRRLGRGFSAEVWSGVVVKAPPGVPLKRGKTVAIKFYTNLSLEHHNLIRVHREFELATQIEHENIVKVYDLLLSPSRPYHSFLVMDLVEGTILKDKIPKQGMPFEEIMDIAIQLFAGLEEIHSLGALHRDVKAANIMLTKSRRPTQKIVLLDLGIVSVAEDPTLTAPSVFLGSKHSAPLEQLTGKELDVRSDIYATGSVLAHCYNGKPLYDQVGPEGAIVAEMLTNPRKITSSHEGISQKEQDFVDFTNQCLEIEKSNRPSSAKECLNRGHRRKRNITHVKEFSSLATTLSF